MKDLQNSPFFFVKTSLLGKLKMIKKIKFVSFFLISLCLVSSLLAQTTEKSENIINGVVEIKPGFQIFPVGKLGNTLYMQGKKLVSQENIVLYDVVEGPEGYVYCGIDENETAILGFVGPDTVEFTQLEGGYYQLVTADRKRKLYRVINKNEIQNLLPRSNTANGLVYNNIDKAAFFHISKGETIEMDDGTERYQYTFKIHIVKDDDPRIVNLPDTITDFRSRLKLDWVDQNTIQSTLSNNEKITFVVK